MILPAKGRAISLSLGYLSPPPASRGKAKAVRQFDSLCPRRYVARMSKRRAIFLDRDGTLNRDKAYVHRIEDWEWLPGVIPALARLKAAGWLLVVVSNQSGIARGMFGHAELNALQDHANAALAPHHADIDAWYNCPHLPEITGPCQCRKPSPGLLLQAAEEWGIDLARSWMIGDKMRDVQAGHACGCKCILLASPGMAQSADDLPAGTLVVPDLPAAAGHILGEQA